MHHSAIETDGYRSLQDNQRVEYEAVRGAKGPQAEHVRPLFKVAQRTFAGTG